MTKEDYRQGHEILKSEVKIAMAKLNRSKESGAE